MSRLDENLVSIQGLFQWRAYLVECLGARFSYVLKCQLIQQFGEGRYPSVGDWGSVGILLGFFHGVACDP